MRKIIILVVAFFCACGVTNTYALADMEANENIKIEEKEIIEGTINGMLRSFSLPTKELNLALQSYKANILNVTNNRWYYTGVYFKVADNKTINVTYNLTSNNNQSAKIGIYDMTTNTWVITTNGLVGKLSKGNLNTSHKYAVGFSSINGNLINGSAIITN